MKNKLRKFSTVSVLLVGSVTLTACDPPMPPELLAQLAEQSYTCVEGEALIHSDNAFESISTSLSEALAGACVEPLAPMTLGISETSEGATLEISAAAPKTCSIFQSIPLGYDAGVVAYNVEGVDSLNLTYKTMAKLLNGEISSWDDPQIAKENPDLQLTPIPVKVRELADEKSLLAIKTALAFQSADLKLDKFKTSNFYNDDVFSPLEPGELAVVPNSISLSQGLVTLGLITSMKNSTQIDFATPSEESLASAGTQLVSKKQGNQIEMVLDPKVKPTSQFEGEAVPTPYQAIYPINLYLCGEDNLLTRAVAGFMLRLDSQGSLGYVNLSQLPEAIRYESVAAVRKGLPTPKVSQKSE